MNKQEFNAQNVTDAPNVNTIFTTWKFKENIEVSEAFERVCGLIENFNNSFQTRLPETQTSCVMGIGYDAWLRLGMPQPMPKELTPFKSIQGDKHKAVSTPGDLHFHLRGKSMSACFDMAMALSEVLIPVSECLDEVHGFRYWDGRSIIGFVDGTENPQGQDREFYGIVGEEDATYKGGSYLFVQKYIHDMTDWNKLPIEEQEKVIGRYKMSDIEMTDKVKPNNSHSALTNVKDENGEALKIVRDNMPFGNPSKGEVGTYFISYASTFSTTNKMLKNMFIGNPVGNYDRILDYSKAVTGALFFVPTLDMLGDYSAE
ncbi:Dyp-type peroxidase [Myroides pelagicus]|uniref:Dyp-type peroxidase n=1 Tax=Myroides pelagicus TaxID=270914 RepID=A0A7K1GGW1_9FLAO|nr:Dyp-type peroxidase [Myroides pelagicus]MEC4113477.1 Dyp-type peroxidase [Myroides pelagicus]MTH28317.1 Dyp-type peroxidase [Myroides pelagicus]